MLKMRRVWRRTSSSQADPSPWRHCWTSWASCSNESSASKPITVQGVSASRLLSQKTAGSPTRPANYGTKTAGEMFPLNLGQAFNRHCTHLTQESLAKQENPGQKKLTGHSSQLTANGTQESLKSKSCTGEGNPILACKPSQL